MTTLTEGFPCFFLSCKANTRIKSAKTGTARTLPNFCVVLCIFVLFYVLFCDVLCIVCVHMCTVLMPPGGYPIADKYIIYHKGIQGTEAQLHSFFSLFMVGRGLASELTS